jgi:hypothetical protein
LSAERQHQRKAARELRRKHPAWGSGLIHVFLARAADRAAAVRTIQRWLSVGPGAVPRGRKPAQSVRAERPHQVWQMDASEEIPLASGQRVSWLRIVDECTGAFLATRVFPPGSLERHFRASNPGVHSPLADAVGNAGCDACRQRLPVGIEGRASDRSRAVDDRSGNPNDLEPAATAAEERSGRTLSGTGKRWGEPERCRSVRSLQERIDALDRIQRDEYLIKGGQTRRDLFPELQHSGRPYRRSEEQKHWDWNRVAAHMAEYIVQHKVDSRGQVTIYKRNHYVGSMYAGQTIRTTFDPTTCEWIFRDLNGNQLRVRPADELTEASILALKVTHRRGQT